VWGCTLQPPALCRWVEVKSQAPLPGNVKQTLQSGDLFIKPHKLYTPPKEAETLTKKTDRMYIFIYIV
jgi:hypothetical protein